MARQQNTLLWLLVGAGVVWAMSRPRPPIQQVAALPDENSAAPGAMTPETREAYEAQRAGERLPPDIWTEPAASPPAEEAVIYPGGYPETTGPVSEGPRLPGYPEPRIIVESPFAAHGYRWW